MDRFFKSLIAALGAVLLSFPAVAGYSQVTPPAGWTAAASTTERATYRAAANELWTGNIVRTSGMISMQGTATRVPAAMRMAANAGRFAGGFAFANPLLLVTLAAAPLILDWFSQQNFFWNDSQQRWERRTTFNLYAMTGSSCALPGNGTILGPADIGSLATLCAQQLISRGNPSGTTCAPSGVNTVHCVRPGVGNLDFTASPQGTSTSVTPVTQADMENGMDGKTMPDGVARAWPSPLPVDDPILNPDAANAPQALRVPFGTPQAIPNTNPQQWKQPVADLVPAPPVPWRIDIQPKDITSTTSTGVTDPVSVPNPNTTPDPNATPKEEQRDLCADHPEILACANLDTPSDTPIPERQATISITADTGWGADNAACPADKHVTMFGRDIPVSYSLFCTFFQGIRPVVIAVAWLIAAFLVVGAVRGQG